MLFNLIVYFAIPWVFGIFLYRKDSRLFLSVFPLSSLLSFLINTMGIYLGYWSFSPHNHTYFLSILLNIGLYPILGTYFIYLLHHKKINLYILLISFTIISTLFKAVMLMLGKTVYSNGWNLLYTFILFIISYLAGYLFYTELEKKQIIK